MNQRQVWNNIAPEWNKFKTKPAEHVKKFLEKQKGNVLDLGCGSGRHLMKIKNGKMYLVDFSKEMIELAKMKAYNKDTRKSENDSLIPAQLLGGWVGTLIEKQKIPAEFLVSDLTKLQFKDNFFDSAIAISSIHCIEKKQNRKKAVKELFRVLKPKAQALIGVWNKNSKRFKNSPKEKFVRWTGKGTRYYYLYEEKEIHDLFKEIGFKIIKIEEPGRMINFIAQKS